MKIGQVIIFILIKIVITGGDLYGQDSTPKLSYSSNLLDRDIEVTSESISIGEALSLIETQANLYFSYNSKIIDDRRVVILTESVVTVEKLLDTIFEENLRYTTIGNHIVLQREAIKSEKIESKFTISGVVTAANGVHKGDRLKGAIIYEVGGKQLSLSQDRGEYNIELTQNSRDNIALSITLRQYRDTIIYLDSSISNSSLNIELSYIGDNRLLNSKDPDPLKVELANSSIVTLFVPDNMVYVSNNVYTNLLSAFQISLIPSIGTRSLSRGVSTNNFSLNIISGYSANISGVEIGSIANIVHGDLEGVEIGGLANLIGHNFRGVQIAGVYNHILGSAKGVQLSGVINIAESEFNGIQIAGVANNSLNRYNYTQPKGKSQISGLYNIDRGDRVGLQIGGFSNYGVNSRVLQLSGVANIATQTAKGLQFSSIFNYSSRLNGVQIGLINYAKEIESGGQLGLINISKNGYHSVELSTDERSNANINYRSGAKGLYSILKVGVGDYLEVGTGLGTTSNYHKRVSLNLDLTASAILNREVSRDIYQGVLFRPQLGLNIKVVNSIVLTCGPAYNIVYSNSGLGDKLYPNGDNLSNFRGDIGWSAGIRFQTKTEKSKKK